ncbi:uncharacterized protein L201_001471 [Kwoniella dendrophila CBS 6074]|uniref:CobW/HypB/UreG nucleotide-binding domain-containing protein n=1 Tax=Kwoniella dendrophila CBS 6074 TaxID=1295534 RepID=A0AAX4JMH1_9TREE
MTVTQNIEPKKQIPVTCFTGFLGAVSLWFHAYEILWDHIQGKTSAIISLIQQLPKDYKVVLLKNEYGDVEVDSILANQSNISGVSEILNGCLCCTMVGLVENALKEIRDTMQPDRIIIESSGSAFPATLALQIKQLEPEGFKLDGVVTVIDCLNFKGYEDSSPSAKLQAKYTDLLLLSKHQLISEREMDDLIDSLNDLNDETPKIKISGDAKQENPLKPDLIFGIDTKLYNLVNGEKSSWENISGNDKEWHGDEIETKQIYKGKQPQVKHQHDHNGHDHNHAHENAHNHDHDEEIPEIEPIGRELLDQELGKLSFEIYRVKGIIRLQSSEPKGYTTNILNYAFGRYELTPIPSLDDDEKLKGASLRLTVMGERGEVARRSRKLAEGLGAQLSQDR